MFLTARPSGVEQFMLSMATLMKKNLAAKLIMDCG